MWTWGASQQVRRPCGRTGVTGTGFSQPGGAQPEQRGDWTAPEVTPGLEHSGEIVSGPVSQHLGGRRETPVQADGFPLSTSGIHEPLLIGGQPGHHSAPSEAVRGCPE